jgi:hypothetical protein
MYRNTKLATMKLVSLAGVSLEGTKVTRLKI